MVFDCAFTAGLRATLIVLIVVVGVCAGGIAGYAAVSTEWFLKSRIGSKIDKGHWRLFGAIAGALVGLGIAWLVIVALHLFSC